MAVHYRQLDQSDRFSIEALLSLGHSQRFVASTLGVSPSTISREVRRANTINFAVYFAALGQRVRTVGRRSAGRLRRKLGDDVRSARWKHVLAGLRQGWSPQQIAGRLRAVNSGSPRLTPSACPTKRSTVPSTLSLVGRCAPNSSSCFARAALVACLAPVAPPASPASRT